MCAIKIDAHYDTSTSLLMDYTPSKYQETHGYVHFEMGEKCDILKKTKIRTTKYQV